MSCDMTLKGWMKLSFVTEAAVEDTINELNFGFIVAAKIVIKQGAGMILKHHSVSSYRTRVKIQQSSPTM